MSDYQKTGSMLLYHATYQILLPSIQKNGLGGNGASPKWEDSVAGVVYLATSPEVAESYAENSDAVPDDWLESIVVLVVDSAALETDCLRLDQNVQGNQGDTVEFHGVIPWEVLNIKH